MKLYLCQNIMPINSNSQQKIVGCRYMVRVSFVIFLNSIDIGVWSWFELYCSTFNWRDIKSMVIFVGSELRPITH